MFKKQKHKLFGKTKTVDEAFEEQRENFKKLLKVYHNIEKDVHKYDSTIKAINNSLQFLGNSFGTLYAEKVDADVEKFKECTEIIDAASKRYNQQQEDLKTELTAYLAQLNDFKHRIAERDNALVMGDAAAEALENLKKKEGNESKIPKAEEEAKRTKDHYVGLNDKLGQDLTEFFDNRCIDFDEKFKMMVASQVGLFRAVTGAFQTISNGEEDETQSFLAAAAAPASIPSKPKRAVAAPKTTPTPTTTTEQWIEADEAESHAPKKPAKKSTAAKTTKNEPALPAKKKAVGKAAASAALRGDDPFDNDQVQEAAGAYIADAAMNEEMQDKAGKAVAKRAKDKESQAKMGNAIAANSDNKLVQAAAKNRGVQAAAGGIVGAAAGSKKIRQATGKAVAKRATDKNSQKKAASFLKKGFGK